MPHLAMATILILQLVGLAGCTSSGDSLLSETLSEPLGGATTAKIEIDPGDGNLTIAELVGSEQELASGTLQYLENQGQPTHTVEMSGEQATLTLKASSGEQPWISLPWAACNGATEWQVQINPKVASDLAARTAGGNVNLNLAGMTIIRLLAETGGGNMTVALPDKAANLNATVKTGGGDVTVDAGSSMTGSNTLNASSGAGNVVVHLPGGIPARIHASSGMGKTIVDSRFNKIDDTTYQSPDYDSAIDRVEITVSSGAGNVTIETN
jgi:hypothetical protein